jgi:hypothetical protein
MKFKTPRYRGRPIKPFEERKIQIPISVKRKHYKEAKKLITEMLNKFQYT